MSTVEDQVLRQLDKRDERIATLKEFGIKSQPGGGVLGAIVIYATDAEKLVRLLKRLSREANK